VSSGRCFRDIPRFAVALAAELRRRGLRVSAADASTAARLLDTYLALGGSADAREVAEVMVSVYAKRRGEEDIVRRLVLEFCGARHSQSAKLEITAAIYKDIRRLGARAGAAIPQPVKRMSAEEREAFARLSLLGLVRRGRRGYYIARHGAISSVAESLAREGMSYHEALAERLRKNLKRGPSDYVRLLGSSVLDLLDLGQLGIRELANLYRSASSGPVRSAAARRIAEIARKEGVDRRDAAGVADILRKHGLIDEAVAGRLLEAEPRLAARLEPVIGREAVLDVAAGISRRSPAQAALLASAALRNRNARGAYELLARHRMLQDIRELDEERLGMLSSLAEAYRSLVNYFTSGNVGYLDAAEYYLGRAEVLRGDTRLSHIYANVEEAVTSARSGLVGRALKILVEEMEPFEAVSFLAGIRLGDEATRRIAATLAARILARARSAPRGVRVKPRYVRAAEGEILDIRETIYNIVRNLPQPLVWRRRRRVRTLVLVLDKSASMRQYSFYALLAAAALAPLVDRLVVFDEKAAVYGRRALPSNWRRLVDLLLSTSFEGHTDIVTALKAATEGVPPRHLVLITDMVQTVVTRRDPAEMLNELASRGWRISLILPSTRLAVSTPLARGVNVYRVEEPAEVERVVYHIASRA